MEIKFVKRHNYILPPKTRTLSTIQDRNCVTLDYQQTPVKSRYKPGKSPIKSPLNITTTSANIQTDNSKNRSFAVYSKQVAYRRLFKNWREYNEESGIKLNLSLFHNHFVDLCNNVFPFTMLREDFPNCIPTCSEQEEAYRDKRKARPSKYTNSMIYFREQGKPQLKKGFRSASKGKNDIKVKHVKAMSFGMHHGPSANTKWRRDMLL